MTLREKLSAEAEQGEFSLIFFDGFDDAIMGLVTRFGMDCPVVLYDRAKCIEILTVRDGMTDEMAEEWMSFNVEGAWVGEETPAFFLRALES